MNGEAPITPLPIPELDREGGARPIIVFGGTFDPPHRAHVNLPGAARAAALPDAWLLYVPAARNPLKPAPGASDADRLAMLRLAMEGVDRAAVWTDEMDRAAWQTARGEAGGSYTIDTLTRLRRVAPAGAPLRLLMGTDQAAQLHRWREPRAILGLAPPMVLARAPITDQASLSAALTATGAWTATEVALISRGFTPTPTIMPPSSTRVRDALARGDTTAATRDVHPAVALYIAQHALYGPSRI